MARLLLGVCGGIAAYKAVEFVRLAGKAGHRVRVLQTASAQRFVGAATFEGITGAPVLVTEWERDPARGAWPGDPQPEHAPLSHLALVERADAFVIAPLTATTLAKLATGVADNVLTAAALATPPATPLIVAPAMNDRMWSHPATQANVRILRERGATVLEPGTGALGSPGEWGAGRLPEPPELLAAVEAALGRDDLAGLRVLVTAGGTREPIDTVRFLGNRSSGRMGYALAGEAARRGARVTVVAANVGLDVPDGVEVVAVQTAAELKGACDARFADCDVLLMAAAVADFRPAGVHAGKIKKDPERPHDGLTLELERTDDVLAGLSAQRRAGQTLVGFAAEAGDGAVAYGRDKLVRKGLDLVVVNDVAQAGIGFESMENEVTLVSAAGEEAIARAAKGEVAGAILDAVLRLRSSSTERLRA